METALGEKLLQFRQVYSEKGWEDDEIDEKVNESLENFPWYKFRKEEQSWIKRVLNLFLIIVILYLAGGAYLAKNRRLRKTLQDKIFDLQVQYQQVRFFRFITLPVFSRALNLQRLRDSCFLSNPFYVQPNLECNFCNNNTAIDFISHGNDNQTKQMLNSGDIFAFKSVPGYENFEIDFNDFKVLFSKYGEEMDKSICEIYHSDKFTKVSEYFNLSEEEVNLKEISIGWKNCEGYGSRFYRELFIRPSFVSPSSEIYLEKYFFFLQPNGNYTFDSVGEADGHSSILQVQGNALVSFFVPKECHGDCIDTSLDIRLSKGQIVIFPNTGWKFSIKTFSNELAISYMSSFLG